MIVCGIDPGVRDLACCVLSVNIPSPPTLGKLSYNVVQWMVTDLSEWTTKAPSRAHKKGTWSVTIEDAVSALVEFIKQWTLSLHDQHKDEEITFVIERQFMNQRMIAVSHAIQACLEFAGYKKVFFVHSMMRFSVVSYFGLLADTDATSGNVKKRSMYLANKLLQHQPERQKELSEALAHQRDDMSDSFLFALSWATTNYPCK